MLKKYVTAGTLFDFMLKLNNPVMKRSLIKKENKWIKFIENYWSEKNLLKELIFKEQIIKSAPSGLRQFCISDKKYYGNLCSQDI